MGGFADGKQSRSYVAARYLRIPAASFGWAMGCTLVETRSEVVVFETERFKRRTCIELDIAGPTWLGCDFTVEAVFA